MIQVRTGDTADAGLPVAGAGRAGGIPAARALQATSRIGGRPIRYHPGEMLDRLSGRTLGEFLLRERIGEGGFGAVYLAEQAKLGREAVVKVLHTHLQGSDEAVARFLREAQTASRLDHPYAAHVYAFGFEHDGLMWIAMERVRGRALTSTALDREQVLD